MPKNQFSSVVVVVVVVVVVEVIVVTIVFTIVFVGRLQKISLDTFTYRLYFATQCSKDRNTHTNDTLSKN